MTASDPDATGFTAIDSLNRAQKVFLAPTSALCEKLRAVNIHGGVHLNGFLSNANTPYWIAGARLAGRASRAIAGSAPFRLILPESFTPLSTRILTAQGASR
jgi:hypothetical protein